MNKSHRDEDKSGRDTRRMGEKAKMSDCYSHVSGSAVDSMFKGKHPTTNMATVACGGKMSNELGIKGSDSLEKEQYRMVGGNSHKSAGKMPKFAAGGVAKVRKGEY